MRHIGIYREVSLTKPINSNQKMVQAMKKEFAGIIKERIEKGDQDYIYDVSVKVSVSAKMYKGKSIQRMLFLARWLHLPYYNWDARMYDLLQPLFLLDETAGITHWEIRRSVPAGRYTVAFFENGEVHVNECELFQGVWLWENVLDGPKPSTLVQLLIHDGILTI